MRVFIKTTAIALVATAFAVASIVSVEARRSGRDHGEYATGKSGGVYNGLLGPAYDYHGCYADEECWPLGWRRAWHGHYYYYD